MARNAGEALHRHKLRRAGDLTTRSKALDEIAEALGMETAPLRIECFDVSQIQGTDVVASMVVFEDGLARKSEYRRFAVRGNPDGSGTDDLAAMSEVLRRRFARYKAQAGESDAAYATGRSPMRTTGSRWPESGRRDVDDRQRSRQPRTARPADAPSCPASTR